MSRTPKTGHLLCLVTLSQNSLFGYSRMPTCRLEHDSVGRVLVQARGPESKIPESSIKARCSGSCLQSQSGGIERTQVDSGGSLA